MADPQGTPPSSTKDLTTVSTMDVAPTPTIPATAPAPTTPAGTLPLTPPHAGQPHATEDGSVLTGVGVEGEETVWVSGYSMKNFVGRLALRAVLTIALLVAAVYAWGYEGNEGLRTPTILFAIVMAVLWAGIILRILSAKLGYKYRITNRRIFISTGVLRRVRDQMELIRVKDLYMHQNSLMERWLQIGTVVVVPSDKGLPTLHIAGIDDPKGLMDLIWHHSRAESDHRSVKIDHV